jgi:glycerophosphoryl diester phosphodiesterase
LANVRALRLELEILRGTTIDQLRQNDKGREFIMPLLEEQSRLQNNPAAGAYGYAAVDGFPVPDSGIVIKPIPDSINNIVLATDGYPMLKASLKESENALREILHRDPLLFKEYKSTKGLSKRNISFDDRAFIKVKLER